MIHAGRRRALAVVACLGAGFALGRYTGAPLTLLLAGGAISASVALFTGGWARRAALLLGCLLLSCAWWTLRIETPPRDALARALSPSEERLVRVEGVALEAPVASERRGRFAPWAFGTRSWRFRLRALAAIGPDGERVSAGGILYVRTGGDATVRAGDVVRVTGMASAVAGASNPGGFASDLWAAERAVAGFVETDGALIEPLDRRGGLITRLADGARARARDLLESADSRVRPLLSATLLGETTTGFEPTRRAFTRLGVAHLLAVSGLHLAALAGVTLAILRAPTWGWRVRGPAAMLVTLCYLAFVPAKAPIIRAGVMTLALVGGEAFGRRHDRVTTLAWAAALVLLWRPTQLWSAGFQLSFGVVAALVTLTGPLRDRFLGPAPEEPSASAMARMKWWSASTLAGATAAWVVATPLVAAHFGVVSPLGVLVGLAMAPVFVATLALGFAAIVMSLLSPALGEALLPVVEMCARAQLWIVHGFDGAPGATVRPAPLPVWLGLAGAAIGAWWLRAGLRASPLRMAVTALWVAAVGHAHVAGLRNGLDQSIALRIDTFSVGDGSCHLIRTPGGAMLWDAGGSDLAAGEREIPQAMRTLGVWRVPDVVITHPNLDHYALLPDLVGPLGVRRVHVGEATLREAAKPDGPEAALLEALERAGVRIETIRAGDRLSIGEASLTILSPPEGAAFDELNDQSLVGLVEAPMRSGAARLLLTGDIQDDAIEALRAAHPGFTAQAIEIPHHGSAREAAMDFVSSIGALVGVQSTGPSRAHDERWNAVRAGMAWLSTAEVGSSAVEWTLDGRMRWRPTARSSAWTVVALRPVSE